MSASLPVPAAPSASHHLDLAARIDGRPWWLDGLPPSATKRTVLTRCRALAAVLAARPGVLNATVAALVRARSQAGGPDVAVHIVLADADALAHVQAHPAFAALVHRLREHARSFEARLTHLTHRQPPLPTLGQGDPA